MAKLDALTVQLLQMTAEVPLYAVTSARARLSRMLARLRAAHAQEIEDANGEPACCSVLDVAQLQSQWLWESLRLGRKWTGKHRWTLARFLNLCSEQLLNPCAALLTTH